MPSVQQNSSGPNFLSGSEAGSSLPLSCFFIANPATPVAAINVALRAGQEPDADAGRLRPDRADRRQRPDTVILGLGFATLVPQNGNAALVRVEHRA